MRLGLFGGSFDPIHRGHIQPVQEARVELGLDRVIFLPTAVPPHKPARQFAPPHARFAMVELALLREDGLVVDPFTVETLRHYRRIHPGADLFLLLGADGFAQLNTWHEWQEIPQLSQLAVLTRPDWRMEEAREHLPPEIAALANRDQVHFIRNEAIDVSATEIRARLAAGDDIPEDAMPGLVLEYIRKYSLYR